VSTCARADGGLASSRIRHRPDAPAVNCVARRRRPLWQHARVFKTKVPGMRASLEISIDLTAQDLLSLPDPTAMVEVDDICAFDPLPQAPAANMPQPAASDTVEIELTAEQIDAMLSGK
jgi:hypothetical protein